MIVDFIIVLIIAISTFLAYKKGLVVVAIQLVAAVIAVLITLVLYKPVTNLVVNLTSIDETIQNQILERANDAIENQNENKDKVIESIQKNMLPETARTISINVIQGAVIIILYAIMRIALRFITAIANWISKLPILNQFNKLGGAIYGAVRGIIIVYVVLIAISLIGEVNPENNIYQSIENSSIGKNMSDKNVLNVLFEEIKEK
ncbi:MAG: CvpA family protein [Clostridia bacterium]